MKDQEELKELAALTVLLMVAVVVCFALLWLAHDPTGCEWNGEVCL